VKVNAELVDDIDEAGDDIHTDTSVPVFPSGRHDAPPRPTQLAAAGKPQDPNDLAVQQEYAATLTEGIKARGGMVPLTPITNGVKSWTAYTIALESRYKQPRNPTGPA
jgi:hypothetical protein